MNNKFINKRRSRKRSVSFNPNRQFIEEAMQEYLKGGGRISHVEVDEDAFEKSWIVNDVGSEVDDFLNGQ